MSRTPITLLDRLGYTFYSNQDGDSFFPADQFEVRLVTNLERLPDAVGDALTSVVGIHRLDQVALRDAARFQSSFGGVKSERIVALTERLLLPAAELRVEMGIAGDLPDDVVVFRDKILMKKLLQRNGIRVPQFAPYSAQAATELLHSHRVVVVKPRSEAGSMDVHIISDQAELAAFEARFADRLDAFEVEEYIAGHQFHIDSVVRDSRVVVATAGHTIDPTTAFESLAPFCDIEVATGPLFDRLLEFNRRVLACYPGFTGVTHHEVFDTGDEIVFCEIAGRLGGGGVRAGFRARTGIDLVEAMIRAQLGLSTPDPSRFTDTISGYTLVYLSEATMRRPVKLSADWVLEQQVNVRPGERIAQPRAWEHAAAIVTVSGADEAQVSERLHEVQRQVQAAFHD